MTEIRKIQASGKKMLFANANEVREAMRNHGVKHGRRIFFTKNLSNKIQVKFVHPYPQYFDAAKVQLVTTFQSRRLVTVHTCTREWNNYCISANQIAKKYEDDIRMNPD